MSQSKLGLGLKSGNGPAEIMGISRAGKAVEIQKGAGCWMGLLPIGKLLRLLCAIAWLTTCGLADAAEHHGQVNFNGFPVPGAAVTATLGDQKFVAITDQQGFYSFPDLTPGTWSIEVEMLGFSTLKGQVLIGPGLPAAPPWELKMLPLDEIRAEVKTLVPAPTATVPPASSAPTKPQEQNGQARPPEAKPPETKPPDTAPQVEETDQRAADGFLINGSTNNGAASPFAQLAAFGNSRVGKRGLYNGGIGMILGNSALDASPYSLSGLLSPKPVYNRVTGLVNFGGPLKIPHILKNGPNFFVGYQWTRDSNNTAVPALVPTLLERNGDFSQSVNALGQPLQIINPATGLPFPGNLVPVSPQAQALLNLYPLPNITGNSRYNFQVPIISNAHIDALQSRLTKTFNRKDTVSGGFAFQRIRVSSPNLFGFVDRTSSLGLNTNVNWSHRYNAHFLQNIGYTFSRYATRTTPNFQNLVNISGDAGITGNNQEPVNWGPPALNFFASGIAGLSDAQSAHNRNQTSSLAYSMVWSHRNHSVTFGGDFRRQEFNYLSQQDARGTFTFTGAATGSDLADFILGVPDTSSIAFGNADKYFRQSVYDAYISDDWRVNPKLTVKVGVRWEYSAPITELFGRLVNLDIAPGFAAVAPVIGNNPNGSLTGRTYPTSLVQPDKNGFAPRVGIAWRPITGSSIVIRAGYGITYDTSVYQNIALLMSQQAPLSTSLRVQNSATCPLTLANAFTTCPTVTPTSFAIDPNFRIGYVQTWQLSVQRDLPWSLQLYVQYLGIKGTRGVQEFLPNTYPSGAANPCPSCPAGFAFLTSNGNSTREAGQVQLRRRLHNGLTATLQYTFSKSIDDDSSFGSQSLLSPRLAQNWLDLRAERGLSSFDQRHLLNVQLQYTTSMGIGGKTLMSGWRAKLYKEWTVLNTIVFGSGLPQTPIFPGAVVGTGFSASLRPNLTGAPLYAAPPGLNLNPAAYAAPASGQWGNAGRNSITGPSQFTFNTSLSRTFRLSDRFNLDLRFDAANILNHVTFAGWVTTVNSSLFGLPATANPMRSIKTTLRLRF